ncbi:PREDICTED: coiled-coil domain-containing protein 116 [Chinchilla lanigera]|uniref:coiled-coil domain-containing protein 116 n=1 Tax=Chinchilla lanigera TaxID=34839 RepID=UPI00038F04C3|nr:PREDICTED: coiled-coil domain-containing protein 116 [Chinchilla lanigera]XP_005391764.1 PREDICTED: coiled-coil domain-containing protein 116 [Chinchilla lanigera]XP_005391765.1 PREDICTED: coiled-coil domain-containing protein 116 [Chinchilla lanigera]XP_013373473.1 PREDICTED: coiled-coil domain-containing protein 116 [Chinchilla lanigera]
MARCRHHSGYLADDEAGHSTYMARVPPPKKPLLPEMGPAFKLGRVPHPPSVDGNSAHRGRCQTPKRPQPFGGFLDFLTEGQVLDSLQTVVEEATERIATMKTEAGVPLVEVQDSVEVPSGKRQVRARPSFSTVKRHRVRPSLCTGYPNNYPSCSSSMSDSSLTAGCLGPQGRDSDLGHRGLGTLPPMKNRLLLEKNLKRLLQLENKGKGWSQSCSQRDSLLWNSLGSQTGSHWTQEQPLSWFSGLLGSSSGTPEASELGPGERELIFLKEKFNKKSLLSQPAPFNLPGYCAVREPHRTLDFLAKHHLFPALQGVVSQASDKLRAAHCHDGFPLFPTNSQLTSAELPATLTQGKETCDANSKLPHKGLNSPSVSNAQEANRVKLKNSSAKKLPPSASSKSSVSHLSNPCFEEIINFLVEQAVSLLTLKYKYESNLNKQLGFISFPVTEALMDLFLGFKKVKGSRIVLSSEMDWSCLLRKLQEAEKALQVSKQATQAHGSQGSSSSSKAGSHRVPTSLQGVSQHSTKSPSTEPMPATRSNQEQAAERGLSLTADTPTHQLLSPWESITAENQAPKSLSQPTPFMSSDPDMGSNLPKSNKMMNTEDKESNAVAEDKGSKEDKAGGMDSYKDERNHQDHLEPGQEAMSRPSVDQGHSDPP